MTRERVWRGQGADAGLARVIFAALALGGCATEDVPDTIPSEATAIGKEVSAATESIPVSDVRLSGYIEIDDIDGLGTGNRDANLCSDDTPSTGAACDNLTMTAADNPNHPGPDPDDPESPGDTGAGAPTYLDWADLVDTGGYFLLDKDALDPPEDDDILKQGPCLDTGPSPSKANIRMVGVAANDVWFYLLTERETTQGQEEYHYFLTQTEPSLDAVGSCANPSWVWDLVEGDIEIVVRFQSTAGLPTGEVAVRRFEPPSTVDTSGLDTQEMVQSTYWTELTMADAPVHAAFNVAPGHKAEADEDTEYNLDGDAYASGQLAEVAVDIGAVFGEGCGLQRVMTVITTASGSGGRTDDLKDIYGPVVVETGKPELSIALSQECTEEIDYEVSLGDWGEEMGVELPDPNFSVQITYDCGDGPVSFDDDDGSSSDTTYGIGPIAVDVASATTCTVSALLTGSGVYEQCDDDGSADHLMIPDLWASASISQAECGGDWTYTGGAGGGLEPYSYSWGFTPIDGSISPTSAAIASGTGTLGSGTAPVDIDGTLAVTDARDCPAGATASATAYHALSLEVDETTGNQECYDGDVAFEVDISGGSGEWTLGWTPTDATLDSTCAPTSISESDADHWFECSYDIGDEVCAAGGFTLIVSDPVCGDQGPAGVWAVRESDLTVSEL